MVSMHDRHGSARLPRFLSKTGFHVATLSFPKNYVSLSPYVTRSFHWPFAFKKKSSYEVSEFLGTLNDVVESWSPEWLIPADDGMALLLQKHVIDSVGGSASKKLRELCIRSMGAGDWYRRLFNRSHAAEMARICGIRKPKHKKVTSKFEVYDFISTHALPVVLKAEYGAVRSGIVIVHDFDDIDRFFAAWHNQPDAIVQQYIRGIPANYTAVTYQGAELAALCFKGHQYAVGESESVSVVEWLNHPEIALSSRAIIGKAEVSGFISFDFILEESTGEAYFVDAGIRPTLVAHLGEMCGRDLCEALYCRINDIDWSPSPVIPPMITLFPQEWRRDPASPFLRSTYHDVPWDEPDLLQRLLYEG